MLVARNDRTHAHGMSMYRIFAQVNAQGKICSWVECRIKAQWVWNKSRIVFMVTETMFLHSAFVVYRASL